MAAHTLEQSHQRSLGFGLHSHKAPEPDLPSHADMADLLTRNDTLCTHARPVMETLREQIADTNSMALLTDSEGTILHALGDGDFLVRASRVALQPGVTWSEQLRGTNAIGTALAEGDAIQIHAQEHYLQANHVLTCACSPIHDPLGNVIGALDVSGDWRQPRGHTLALVRMSAQMVENHLFISQLAHCILLHFHAHAEFVGTLAGGLAAFTPDGRFVSANRSGQFQLGMPLRALQAHTFASLFGTSISTLFSHIRQHGQTLLKLHLHNGGAVMARAIFDRPPLISATPGEQESFPIPAPRPRAASTVKNLPQKVCNGDATALGALLKTGDPRIGQAIERVRKVLNHRDVSILILGETGTGKEVLTKALHHDSSRSNGPFVAVNCASIPETLIESELFGYEEGAFTGARRKGHPGKIAQAHGGTLFLDEIGDMPLHMQGRLLRVLQEQLVTPLGGTRDIRVEINVVSATHCDLRDMIARGKFREDLYYRLNGLTVQLPALRERQDLNAIIEQLLEQHARQAGLSSIGMDDSVRDMLLRHPWPGNFRQLSNVLRNAVLMADDTCVLQSHHLPDDFREGLERSPAIAQPLTLGGMDDVCSSPLTANGIAGCNASEIQEDTAASASLKRVTVNTVRAILARHGGNISAAARALNVSRNTIYRYMRQTFRSH